MTHRLTHKNPIDLEALSPRDANAQRLPRTTELKTKMAAQVKSTKNKEHPAPPPAEVNEPASADTPEGVLYKVGKLLGKGGFAICYEGFQQPSNKRHALKIVKSKMPPKMEQKFQTELQIHSKMRHKNIVQFHRAFAFTDSTYLVLELCPNGSLMDMVKRRKGLTEAETRFYSVQVAGAIKYMHGKGIIHRDLKMGNIFLDSHMNAKIGDFGLAALLVTGKDMHTIRRTTLCGTPNYIAPEILQKGKLGHDHQVDIWSLGIIVFAMLTSKPPFQSSTTDEIYRRAKDREYEWPTHETSNRIISEEAKDLVATMLQDAESRPDPDGIVQHPFFTSGYMPSEADMSSRLREMRPDRQEFYATEVTGSLRTQSLQNLKVMCKECVVGYWGVGKVSKTQVWKEMAAEEKAGLTPMIPLADDMVYRPFDEWVKEQNRMKAELAALNESSSTLGEDAEGEAQRPPVGLLRQPPQSFAAQQRMQSRPPTTAPATSRPKASEGLTTSHSMRIRREAREAREARQIREAAATDRITAVEIPLAAEREPTASRTTRPSRSEAPPPRAQPRMRQADSVDRLADKVAAVSLGSAQPTRPTHKRTKSDSIRNATLFNPAEQAENISGTKPDLILERLQRLQTELERALNSRTMAIISSKTVSPPHPHIVVKWVDYTNKFGLGYILNDGSVGCILRDIPTTEGSKTCILPPAGVFIRNAEKHIMRQNDAAYYDRKQPIPMTQHIKFFENNGEKGLAEVHVSPEQFRVPIADDGTAGKMNPGKDVYEHRKRERIILWKKFANYMIAYGRDEAVPVQETEKTMSPGVKGTPAELVTFYQRFGDVGCWVYCDGHLQFNFPDHTKIVIDATGTWCHFWHLPEDAAKKLATDGTIGAEALDERGMLSYPLQTLLNFHSRSTRSTATSRRRPEIDPEIQGIPNANDFRRKIEFIKNVVKEWVTNGGLGNSSMARETRLRWTGFRETVNTQIPQKHFWVTIGARWGDEQRITTFVDPRKPWELGEEVETSSSSSSSARR